MSVPNAKRTFEGRIQSVLACSGATRRGCRHKIPAVIGIDRKRQVEEARVPYSALVSELPSRSYPNGDFRTGDSPPVNFRSWPIALLSLPTSIGSDSSSRAAQPLVYMLMTLRMRISASKSEG
jgi:hypothetical protein